MLVPRGPSRRFGLPECTRQPRAGQPALHWTPRNGGGGRSAASCAVRALFCTRLTAALAHRLRRSGNMAPRALLAFVVAAGLLNVAVAATAATCPTPSATNITCYSGATMSPAPTSGGKCTCMCGASSATADYDYTPSNSGPIDTLFVAASASACTNAACANKFPNACTKAYVSATYTTWPAVQAAVAPKTSTAPATTQLCISYSYTCGPSMTASNCPYGLPGPATVTAYGRLDTSQSSCATIAQTYSTLATGLKICNTANCNAPSSAAVKSSAVFSVLVALAVAVAALLQ